MHLDVKSPNILLTQAWEARIADVGLGKKIHEDGSIATQGKIGGFIDFSSTSHVSRDPHNMFATGNKSAAQNADQACKDFLSQQLHREATRCTF